ncbi:MAG: porin [Pseudomonadota bacterium]
MKKALLPLAIASLLPTAAFADVIVYGRANVTVQAVEKFDTNYTEVASNASRIGVKGSEVINDDLKVIYQFEYQTKMDDGGSSQTCSATSLTTEPATTTTTCKVSGTQTFTQRNIYVGLQGTGGTLMAGMFDTPLKASQEKVDLFNDLIGDLTFVLEGEIRARNIVQYSTPAFANITLNAAYIASEQDVENAVDGISASAVYNSKPFYFALAADQNVKLASDQTVSAVDVDLARAVARVTFGPVVLGAMYEVYDNGVSDDDEDGFLVSAQFNINDEWALKAQTVQSDMVKLGSESSSVGVDYKMSKAAKLFGFYTVIEDELTRDDKYLAVGVELNF